MRAVRPLSFADDRCFSRSRSSGRDPLAQRAGLAKRIGHTDPAKYRNGRSHGSVGDMACMTLVPGNAMTTNLQFVHRCQMMPKGGGVGHHFHNQCEEMFVIFDGEAEFTIDGHTSLLQGTVGAPVRMGHSHAIYNPTTPVEFMNINVTAVKGQYDAFNLDDAREGAPKDPKPAFMTMRLDKARFANRKPIAAARERAISPRAQSERVSEQLVLHGSPVDYARIVRRHARHPGLEEVYYVISGDGEARVDGETGAIHKGDAVPVLLNEPHSFVNTGTQDLEIMIIGVAMQKGALDVQEMDANPPARGRGRGAQMNW